MIIRAFQNAFKNAKIRNWDKIYVFVDVHGVLMESNYKGVSVVIHPECLEPLRRMSNDPFFVLIMWTCSTSDEAAHYFKIFEDLGIKFKYLNDNPEVKNGNGYGDYSKKQYANILIDDKAGFEVSDWFAINDFLKNEQRD